MKAQLLDRIFEWFGAPPSDARGRHGHDHGADGAHGHTHGAIDPTIATTERGIWALKWSFAILAVTAAMQIVVVLVTGSVALLADTIHNFSDAATAIPLWIAFRLAQRKPTATFTYGYGRFEDLAGIAIVLMILFSALVAGYVSVQRLFNPEPIALLQWVALAGLIGFIGNEVVAVLRIRVGREINSAALIADGYHARTDGLTSLAVVAGAVGVWLGFPLADPIIGLLITVAIFGIVWQSGKSVFTRMLDGVDPAIIGELHHAAGHVPGVKQVTVIKARWLGHQLQADFDIQVGETLSIAAANSIGAELTREVIAHVPTLSVVNVRFGNQATVAAGATPHQSHTAPQPFKFANPLAVGMLEIADTPRGERMRLTLERSVDQLQANVTIDRADQKTEMLRLFRVGDAAAVYESEVAPGEPHEFAAKLSLRVSDNELVLPFRMTEPAGHRHD